MGDFRKTRVHALIVTCRWEIANGSSALLLEQEQAPRRELRIVRGGQVCR
jgi:hypothetical protein